MNFQSVLKTATSTLAVGTVFLAVPAFAQSTGSAEFEGDAIVVSGVRETAIGGIDVPETPKAKVAITKELISHQTAGQTINETLNLVPGVSFTNNDPWGSLGGSFTVRGFSSDRISQTVDGIPLNDSGNYALYTNQMLDPEIIESATVSLGSTDVDSPTASAAGGTINIRSIDPSDDFGVLTSLTYGNVIARGHPGDRMMYRGFILVNTGEFTAAGTKAWFSASKTENDSTFSNYGGVDKQQYNGKIYQPIGDNGDFISVAGHYNENRNNFNGSPASLNADGWSIQSPSDRFYTLYDGTPCTTDTPEPGEPDSPNSCGAPFERRYNPSNTGNIRVASRFTLMDNLILNVEPYYQYVKANGGGTGTAYEYGNGDADKNGANGGGLLGQIGGRYYAGIDLNGDGDLLDSVRVLAPSQTQTDRIGVIANLAYDINDQNRVRISYTFDRARHRQSGQIGYLKTNGEPYDVFPVNDPILTADGFVLNKRDRKSIAMLNQVSGEYRGSFMDDSLVVLIGARVPFFQRELNQYCFSAYPGDGYGNCIASSDTAAYLAAYPDSVAPTSRTYNYSKFLPSAGITYKFTPEASMFVSYAKNLSVPGTDDLYGALYFAKSDPAAKPSPETSDSFDIGIRYQTGNVQAQIAGWYNTYQNRLASSYFAECDCSITTNLGKVEKYGVDGSVSWRPIDPILVYVFGSALKSKIKNDVLYGTDCGSLPDGYCHISDGLAYVNTAGKRERGAPIYTLGGRIQGTIGSFDIGAQVKRTGKRYLNDVNDETIALPGYTVVDLDVRFSLEKAGLDKSYLQLNITNLFDEVYIGSASGGLTTTSSYVNIGAPRAISASFIMGF
ncbi:TonB-dependent receptor [Novosphingobium mangrovi (ex Huang et al. 2023)]|uniref:TonB-dependent receptor n=1 Tax=Novosphingobium mangrovi (ex Huang et al. 2023) TaxID=2976432 RepID=A0ABT2I4J1_9SPHN|nr:TonB-dependent receptor [Novosphingobium mangrovi (ex Huang et al. 2023)]MCT2399726.1 TonB-dependent receptor [Novosphingobium mangrovi (ex Huang et al. 2023)]